MPNEYWAIYGQCQISNLNWKMENAFPYRFRDLLTENSFLMLEGIAQQENMPRGPKFPIDRENILSQQIRIEPPAGSEIRENASRGLANAPIRFFQTKTRQSPAEAIRKEVEIGRALLSDRHHGCADEGPAPEVCLKSEVRGGEVNPPVFVLEQVTCRVFVISLADERNTESQVRAQYRHSPQSVSQAEARGEASDASVSGRVHDQDPPDLFIDPDSEQRAFETIKKPVCERATQSESDL